MRLPKSLALSAVLSSALVLSPKEADADMRRCIISLTGNIRNKVTYCMGGVKYPWKQENIGLQVSDEAAEIDPDAIDSIRESFRVWGMLGTDIPNIDIEIVSRQFLSAKKDGLNTITIGETGEGNLGLTELYPNYETETIEEADIIISRNHDFRVLDEGEACSNENDLRSVMIHEAGHFFGLHHDWYYEPSVMYFGSEACEVRNRISLFDWAAIRNLYGLKKDRHLSGRSF